MDLETLMKAAAGSMSGSDDNAGLTDVQIATRLREAFAMYEDKQAFEPGQIILHKAPDLAITKHAIKPTLFLGYLPEPIRGWECDFIEPCEMANFGAALTFDCRIVQISKGAFVPYLADSSLYKLHPNFLPN